MMNSATAKGGCRRSEPRARALFEQALSEYRQKKLVGVVEKTEAGVPVEEVADGSHEDLAHNLTHFRMWERCWPWTKADSTWCGAVSLLAHKLYGATADLSYGPVDQDIMWLASSTILGLNMVDPVALFEAG